MLLILTNENDETANFLEPKLRNAGVRFVRIDTDLIVSKARVSFSEFKPGLMWEGKRITPNEIQNVLYRRPEPIRPRNLPPTAEGLYEIQEWSEAIEGFLAHIPSSRWLNHPLANAAASHKIRQLSEAKGIGFLVPETIVTQDKEELITFFASHDGEVVVKPMGTGYIDRNNIGQDTLVFTNKIRTAHLNDLDCLGVCPTLFQQYVKKRADIRVTILDQTIVSVELTAKDEVGSQLCDIRRDNMENVSYRIIDTPAQVAAMIKELMRLYGLRYSAIDFVVDFHGEWYFLEVNPNGQWAWLDLAAGTKIAEEFARAFAKNSRAAGD